MDMDTAREDTAPVVGDTAAPVAGDKLDYLKDKGTPLTLQVQNYGQNHALIF